MSCMQRLEMEVTMRKAKKPCPERSRGISKKQLSVIDDLFDGTLDGQAVLDKYNVKSETFKKWLNDERFIERLNERITHSFWQSRLFVARFATLAASRLVQLTESENQETARKACLDIISTGSVERLAPPPVGGVD